MAVPITVGASPSGVAVGAGAVWVANSGDSTVSRIDPVTSRTTTIEVRPGPTGIVVAFGSVWVTNALDASVTEIDPDTNKVVHVVPVGASPIGIAAGAGYLWVTNQGDGTVTRFDPDTYVPDSPITVGSRAGRDRGRRRRRLGREQPRGVAVPDRRGEPRASPPGPWPRTAARTASPPPAATCGSATSTPAP